MLIESLIKFRERYHPLHWLRQSRFVARQLLPLFDQKIFISMDGVAWPVRVRRMRHLTYVLANRVVEPGVVAVARTLQSLSKPEVFWDIGANAGFYSWLLMSADPRLRTVLFEPDPDNVDLIRDTIAHSSIEGAELVAKAASATEGSIRFVVDSVTSATGHIEGAGRGADGDIVNVEATTLDAELEHRPAPDLIKIDVEGSEELVLSGAKRLLLEVRPIILIECFGGLGSEALRCLMAAGYALANADDPRQPAGSTGNYLCLPGDSAIGIEDVVRRFPSAYIRWVGGPQ